MNKLLLSFTLLLFNISIFSQDTTLVEVDADYKFQDGLFISFDQVKQNAPIPVNNIIASGDKNSKQFWDKLFENETIYFIDFEGQKMKVDAVNVFGFSYKGKLYIRKYNETALVPVLGQISHFTIAYNVTQIYDPFYDPLAYPQTSNRIETKQMIIDFETGQIIDFNIKNIEPIFAKDAKLYAEWAKLSKRKKKKLIFVYLQKYNKNNKLYLPK